MEDRVLILVDSANIAGAARGFNRKADFSRLRDYLAPAELRRHLVDMFVYVGLPPSMEKSQATDEIKRRYREKREGTESFIHALESEGLFVVTLEGTPTNQDEAGFKANVDVLMAVDAVELAIDIRPAIVVLVTGDGDFAYVARKLRRRGIRVEVATTQQSLSPKLRKSANGFIDLTELLNEFPPLRGSEPVRVGTDAVFDETI